MPLYQVVVLGVVQGLTEFLPVSSTAHLYLVRWLFGWETEGLELDVMLHLGTLFAVVAYFAPDAIQIMERPLVLELLALASLPVGLAGLVFRKQAQGPWRSPFVIGAMLIAVGILLAFADRAPSHPNPEQHVFGAGRGDALAIGFAQALAVIPGVSRSGITIAAGLFRGLDAVSATFYSFLLSIPPVAAATALTMVQFRRERGLASLLNARLAAGIGASAITGYATIGAFLNFLQQHSLRPFAYYRVLFGIIVIALAFIRRPAR